MEASAVMMAEEALEVTRWEDEELDLLAFKLWKRASCPEAETDQEWAEPEPWSHASCL